MKSKLQQFNMEYRRACIRLKAPISEISGLDKMGDNHVLA